MKINIRVNGSDTEIENLTHLEDLVDSMEVKKQGLIAELNNNIIHRERWKETTIHEGDVIELINFVGGG